MILSDKEIRAYAKNPDTPLISPFSEEQLQAASYDVSMSGKIAVLKNMGKIIDPSGKNDLSAMYEQIVIGDNGYLLIPGDYILVELKETIHIPQELIAHIRPRTRFTRSGILVASQHCNPTYSGVLQIGIYNAGKNAVLLRPGLKIAQIIFEEVKSVPSEEKLYQNKKNAAYRDDSEFRGSVFGEAGWSEEGKKLYTDVMTSFEEGEHHA